MLVLGAVFLISLLQVIAGDINILLNPGRRCVPTTSQVGSCHVCICTIDGIFHCHAIKCNLLRAADGEKKLKPKSNKRALPEIREGEPCFPGRLYKLECNTCRCTKDQTLMCTKMGCLDVKKLDKPHGKKVLRQDDNNQDNKKETKPEPEPETEKKNTVKKAYLPKIQRGMVCKPGKIYRSKCKRCFCTADNIVLCSKKKEACTFDKFGNAPLIMEAEDVHPELKQTEIQALPELSSASERCQPGKRYRVDCNFCVCMDSSNLICQKKLCVSFDDMNRIQAKDLSGKPCNDDPVTKDCVVCTCKDGVSQCNAIPKCSAKLTLSDNGEHPTDLDPTSENIKCVPLAVYKTDCNKCYCQEDGSLRCTQKTCLNYSQVKLLEEQREYLEKHGL